jgi:hypothetical protein
MRSFKVKYGLCDEIVTVVADFIMQDNKIDARELRKRKARKTNSSECMIWSLCFDTFSLDRPQQV